MASATMVERAASHRQYAQGENVRIGAARLHSENNGVGDNSHLHYIQYLPDFLLLSPPHHYTPPSTQP
jgi:hypothetical protein